MRVFQSALVLIIACPIGTLFAADVTLRRLEFEVWGSYRHQREEESSENDRLVNNLSREDPMTQVKVFLEVDTVQPDETQGLAFTIEIINESDKSITISDPTEASGVILYDDKSRTCGLPMLLERTHSGCYRDTDPEAKRARLDAKRARLDAERAFVIDRPEAGAYPNTTKTIHEVNIENGRVTLQPGERLWLPLRIMEVRAHPITKEERSRRYRGSVEEGITTTQAPPASPERAPISAGVYKLTVHTNVTSWQDGSGFTSTELTKTLGVPIRLGAPASE